jgi:hypothetical protein
MAATKAVITNNDLKKKVLRIVSSILNQLRLGSTRERLESSQRIMVPLS